MGKIVTNGHGWNNDVSWLLSPLVAAVVFTGAALLLAGRFLRLRGGAAG